MRSKDDQTSDASNLAEEWQRVLIETRKTFPEIGLDDLQATQMRLLGGVDFVLLTQPCEMCEAIVGLALPVASTTNPLFGGYIVPASREAFLNGRGDAQIQGGATLDALVTQPVALRTSVIAVGVTWWQRGAVRWVEEHVSTNPALKKVFAPVWRYSRIHSAAKGVSVWAHQCTRCSAVQDESHLRPISASALSPVKRVPVAAVCDLLDANPLLNSDFRPLLG